MSTARAYDVLAPAYDLLTAGYAYGPWLGAIDSLARSHGLRGQRALDVACGTGKSLEALLDLGYDAIGCDGSAGMAEVARDKLAGRAEVFVADMCSLGVVGAFDLITCLDDALNHLPSPADVVSALRAMGANLASDGLLAFDVNTLGAYRDTGDRIVEERRPDRAVARRPGTARRPRRPRRGRDGRPAARAATACGAASAPRGATGTTRSPRSRRWCARPGSSSSPCAASASGGHLEPDADEDRHRKAVFLARLPSDLSEGR